MQPQALMLFAAGFGTRMGDLTRSRPKPLIPVAGRPLIDHALDLCDAAGVGRVVVNTHYLADQIHTHLSGRPGIAISHEAPDILDTGGGLRHALPLLGAGPVFSLNSDAVWTGPNPLDQLRAEWDGARMDGLLLLVPRDRARGHGGTGDFIPDAAGRLTRGPGAVYSGAQILKPDLLADIRDSAFSLNRLWDSMLAQGRLYGVLHRGGWCDVGHPGGITQAEAMLAEARDD
ncbi:nucleotidyltransferase family protein [Rhodovulum adriaticum]|uniref:MurNAc alpha-1-phosphate uridylyltransferase n=1 Tax=Rhodovulum adriaticum TaxID=35804 RepID=A0A4R2P1J5_RHOAD|nr:nucleotidyltransferase family protein [Rhodovulum adriaticum]MBK1636152.1 nucleotidyltransferase [Rhodovulum adriaticum]TCP27535.1 MurNAc alpha-1-phosphate uridylyltransferase [Rhodovulum adriaticum]